MTKATGNFENLVNQFMRERGLQPEFSFEGQEQLSHINLPAPYGPDCVDLRALLWCSIDNDDSRDLDQLTFGENESEDVFALWIAVADVDALVKKDSPIDLDAQVNTTSVYTPSKIYSMLPEKLSTNLTSLNENEDRLALVVKIKINGKADRIESSIFRAFVRNHAKLAYPAIGDWLEGKGEAPEKVANVEGLAKNLKIQHEAAQKLKDKRQEYGALTLESPKTQIKLSGEQDIIVKEPEQNYARQLIQEFMIAANQAMAEHFKSAGIESFRRVVHVPKRWNKIQEIAKGYGFDLPDEPSPIALDAFLTMRKQADPVSFPDLSLVVIKLLGRGEYVIENQKNASTGHFGLALSDYTHSTAPNRRYPDLISQRQWKAHLQGEKNPYSLEELQMLAAHCTQQEDAANKVERQATKSAAAIILSPRIGQNFQGIITGSDAKGTWVRIFDPPVEGKVTRNFDKLDVGDRVSVRLVNVDISKGFIDFVALAQ